MAKPALTIDVDAKTTKYDRAMQAIGDAADKKVAEIESKFESFDPQLNVDGYTKSITAIASRFGVAGVAAGALIGLVVNLNKALAETGELAERVGVSTDKLQQYKFAANSLGIGDDEFNRSLDSFASKLQDAKFKANDLTRVFQANGVAIKDNNGKLKDTGVLLEKAIDLVKRQGSIQDAIQVGGFLGFGSKLSQQLKDAGDGFLQLASQANAAGAVVDEATIEKAKEFDREWTKAAALWGTNLKAAIGAVLPLLNEAVNGAVALINAVSSISKFIQGIKDIVLRPSLDSQSIGELQTYLADLNAVKKVLQENGPFTGNQALTLARAARDQGTVSGQGRDIENIDAEISKINELIATKEKAAKRVYITGGNTAVNPGPAATQQAEPRDQFDRTVDQITKRTATINADTAATFQNNAAQAQFRAEFQLLTAIMRDNGEVTQQQIDVYEKFRKTMSAQQALEAAGIQLTADHRDKFIAAAAGIKTATLAYDQTRDSLNKLNSASSQVGSALSSAFSDAIVEGKSLGDVLTNLAKTLEKMAINSVFSSLFNAPASGGLSPIASAISGLFGHNASGTDNWRGGPTWVGENGPEIIDAPAGSRIIPNSFVARSNGGSSVSFGDINVMVPEGTSPTNAAAIAQAVKASVGQMVDERIMRQMRPRGLLS